ncbi:MAG: hypothetical protein COZ06_09280 [Armatimonadetes bacterium CG_4_10_14_3_um_filter_66_18]|nr:hypothetical protein [Armatimonadota bacterium]OIO95840.1 MAG: hypothetical protein AUJ96_25845 [Armatimonadetes bacterium CG2_30_66_41]PIU89141.1 MAG: hypothetical protein COS65_29120 [Armatimonadetes bacterium CG06_land_8_20_14_3_00_66_21]PIX40814.1 MAG: hypothetical protein COZ57_24980 [Armatimonadetes bacterium CG_4_8_14_3_um_filter_66_20]PIY50453.1 MAG: hypothetical protein COZ06_09280 [Armatimonadetes bacterium CG_4_10_14_3_um_filter_66_18]PIZ50854.1 MAG: hypothetical protein COY42_00
MAHPSRYAAGSRYLLSLPERSVRAAAAGVGGLFYETAELALPDWLRRSRVYQAVVGKGLRVAIELVGGVEGLLRADDLAVRELFVRKAAGNAIELASFLATGWSPLWLLAPAADLAGGSRTYLRALVEELKGTGVLPQDADIGSVDELFGALEGTSGVMAETIDVPPLTVADMRQTWEALKAAADLPDAKQLAGLCAQLQQAAQREGRSVASVSSLIALGALKAGARMGHEHLFDYYHQSLRTILSVGLRTYATHALRPYFAAAKAQFNPGRQTATDALLRRLQRRG